MAAIAPGTHPAAAGWAAVKLVPMRIPALGADEQRRRVPAGRDGDSRAPGQHPRGSQSDLVCLRPPAAHADRPRPITVLHAVHRPWTGHGRRHVHRARGTERRPSGLVPVAEHVPASTGTPVDQRVGAEPERGLEPRQHIVRTLPQRHPRRELRLPCAEHARRPRLGDSRQPKSQAQLVSLVDGQRASQGAGAPARRPLQSSGPGECRDATAAVRVETPSVNQRNHELLFTGTSAGPHARHEHRDQPGKAARSRAAGPAALPRQAHQQLRGL